jgi:hypothetical protein
MDNELDKEPEWVGVVREMAKLLRGRLLSTFTPICKSDEELDRIVKIIEQAEALLDKEVGDE